MKRAGTLVRSMSLKWAHVICGWDWPAEKRQWTPGRDGTDSFRLDAHPTRCARRHASIAPASHLEFFPANPANPRPDVHAGRPIFENHMNRLLQLFRTASRQVHTSASAASRHWPI
eukprot:scaffold1396_cov252-Pinguiococcus_pyrenoidosus.AAC.22